MGRSAKVCCWTKYRSIAARRTDVWRAFASSATTHTHSTALFPGLPGSAGTRKVKTDLDFTEARDSEWQWHQLGNMQVCISLQTDNHASTPPLSVKALKA